MIRTIQEKDYDQVAEIYNYYILNDICTFEVNIKLYLSFVKNWSRQIQYQQQKLGPEQEH